jgi:trypsin-like peptidase
MRFIVGLLACLCSAPSHAQRFNEIVDANAQAVVYLEIRDADRGVVSRGSGFIVSHDGHVITVAHLKVTPTQRIFAVIGQRHGASFPLELREADEIVDIALWQFPQSSVCRTAATLASKPPTLLAPVLALGFPGSSGLTANTLAVSNLQSAKGYYKSDGFLEPGSSGGPVFDQVGQVIGIVHGGGAPGTENNEIIPISLATTLLRRWSVPAGIDNPVAYAERCYAPCRSPQHGIERWGTEVAWGRSSGWMGGGNNPSAVCNGLASAVQIETKSDRVIVQQTGENAKKDILGRVEYRYHCRGIVQKDPVYVEKRSSACGLLR